MSESEIDWKPRRDWEPDIPRGSDLDLMLEVYARRHNIKVDLVSSEDGYSMSLRPEKHDRVEGYSGQWTVIRFDRNGRFVKQEVWE